MNILIVRLSSIGDVIHTLAPAGLLKRHFSGCSITWVAEEPQTDLLRGHPDVDHVIVLPRRELLHAIGSFRLARAVSLAHRFVRRLRRRHYDIVIDFQGLLKSGLVTALARGKRKVGYRNAREGSTLFYTEKAPAQDFHAHAITRHAALAHYLGVPVQTPSCALQAGPRDNHAARGILNDAGIDSGRPVVLLHPCARWATKRWSHQAAARLCDRLYGTFGCRVVLVGGSVEHDYLESIAGVARTAVPNLAGRTTLPQLAALCAHADLMVSADSGPMHLACAVGTPVIALFGPTAPWRTGPFGHNDSVVRKELPCSPCFQKKNCPEGHHRCMQDITVEDIMKVCCNYFGQHTDRR